MRCDVTLQNGPCQTYQAKQFRGSGNHGIMAGLGALTFSSLPGETMDRAPDSATIRHDRELTRADRDRRSQPRDSILSKIEDATYAVLRKHEKKTA